MWIGDYKVSLKSLQTSQNSNDVKIKGDLRRLIKIYDKRKDNILEYLPE